MTAIVTAITHRRKTFIIGPGRIPERKRRWSKKHGDSLLRDIEIARLQNLREQRRRRAADEPKPEPVSLDEVELDVQDANRKVGAWGGEGERPKTIRERLHDAAEDAKAPTNTSNDVHDFKAALAVITKDAVDSQELEDWNAFLLGDALCPPPTFQDPWHRAYRCWQSADQWLAQCKAEGLDVFNIEEWHWARGVLHEVYQRSGTDGLCEVVFWAWKRLRRGLVLLDLNTGGDDDECLSEVDAYFVRQRAETKAAAGSVKSHGPRKAVYVPGDMFEKQLRASCDTKEQNAWNQMQPADLPKGVRLWAEPPSNEALANLERRFPHFHEVLDLVRQRSALARLAQAGLSLPPILLLGPPGVGKTHFARALAQAIQVHCEFVDMSCTTASWILSGASRGWEGAKPGRVHDVLLKHRHFNPVFVLDEVDKASDDRRHSPLAPLYQLLERSSAKVFRDEHNPVPLDASGILWIGTANTSNLSAPLLSRMEVFTIDVPDEEQRKAIIQSVYQELQQGEDWGKHFPDALDDAVVDFLAQSTAPAREVRRSMEAGFARAVMRNNGEPLMLAVDDVREGLHLPPVKRRIGFTT